MDWFLYKDPCHERVNFKILHRTCSYQYFYLFQYCSLSLTCNISIIWLVERSTISAVLYSQSNQMLQNTGSYLNKGEICTKWSPKKQLSAQSQQRNTRKRCEVCSKIIMTPEQSQWRFSDVFHVNFKRSSHLFIVFLLLLWANIHFWGQTISYIVSNSIFLLFDRSL